MQHGMHPLASLQGDRQAADVDEGVKPRGQPPDFRASSHEKFLIEIDPYALGRVKVTANRSRWVR